MCYTLQDSRNSYIINLVLSILLLSISKNKPNYIVIAYFFLFVGQMQLFDYLFWHYLPPSSINTLSTRLAILFNHLQPLVLIGLQYYYGLSLTSFSVYIFYIYLVCIIPYTIYAFRTVEYTYPKNNTMYWEWNYLPYNKIIYFFFILSLIASSFNFTSNIIKSLAIFSVLITIYIGHKLNILNISFGRMWCYFASFVPLLFILIQ